MAVCVYCDQHRPPTREHIWPEWLLNATDYPIAYLGRANKIVGKNQTIRDVCAGCNNGQLSRLDGYARGLYETYIRHWVVEEQVVDFRYDHGLLLRWLLKVAYNSARTTGQDAPLLAKYRQVLIAEDPCTPLFAFAFAGTIMPAYVMDPGTITFRRIDPRGARCGRMMFEGLAPDPRYAMRFISINGYWFSLLIVDDMALDLETFFALTQRVYGTALTPDGITQIPAPRLNALQAMQGVESWPGLADGRRAR
jgi:hypothetical protein